MTLRPGDSIANDQVSATVTAQGNGQYELRFRPKVAVTDINWPLWLNPPWFAGGDEAGDLVYTGAGIFRSDALPDWHWLERGYPGIAVSPVIVLADDSAALLVSGRNYPPKPCTISVCRGRARFRWGAFQSGREYSLRIVLREHAAKPGAAPWQLAALDHAIWIEEMERMPGFPRPYWPQRARLSEGFYGLDLHNAWRSDPAWIESQLRKAGHRGLAALTWGQMCHYAGPPEIAVPPRHPHEPLCCCHPEPELHRRYALWFPQLAREACDYLPFFGVYTRPLNETCDLSRPEPTPEWRMLADWLGDRRRVPRNAVYLDMIGGYHFGGDPLAIARRVIHAAGEQVIVGEGAMDVYPWAQLWSGIPCGGAGGVPGGPGRNALEHGSEPATRFIRLLLGRRDIYLGHSNGGYLCEGRENDYWLERQAALLGARLDVRHMDEGWETADPADDVPQPMQVAIHDARVAADWWRLPGLRYMDTLGVTEQSDGLDVRVFIADDGRTYFAVDNPTGQPGSFTRGGVCYDVPADPISIIEPPHVAAAAQN